MLTMNRRDWLKSAGLGVAGLAAGVAPALAQAAAEGPKGSGFVPKTQFVLNGITNLDGGAGFPYSRGGLANQARMLAARTGEGPAYRPNARDVIKGFGELVNADADEIAMVPTTSIAEQFVVSALGLPEKGAHVVTDETHFSGSIVMYQELQKRGVEVTFVPVQKDGSVRYEDFEKAIRKDTRLVAVSGISFMNGFQHDLKHLCDIAHAKNVPVYADVIHMTGAMPLDLKATGVDFAAAASYKWLVGEEGAAFLYVRRDQRARLSRPYVYWSQLTGQPQPQMYAFDPPAPHHIEYLFREDTAGLFNQGGQATEPLALLEYSLPWLKTLGPANIQAAARPLVHRLKTEVPRKGYRLLTPIDNPSAIAAFELQDSATRLQPVMQAAKIKITCRRNLFRISVAMFNDDEDIDRLVAALPKISA
jgi:selenocysteine lyase/cysteine desulfurase